VALADDGKNPFVGVARETLALAEYQAGDWAAAVAAAEKAYVVIDIAAEDFLVLALARARRGERGQARPYYEKAARWLDDHPTKDPVLCGLRAEADDLLGPPVGPPAPRPDG